MSGSTELDNSAVLAFEAAFMVAAGQDNVMDQLAQYRSSIGAKSVEMTKYARLAKATTPLGEYDEAGRVTMADTQILFTPVEYGQAVTTTKLMSLQSGGKIDLAAAQVVGINAGATTNQLAVNALNASSNVIFAGTAGTEAGVAAGDVMAPAFLNKMYNQLARTNIQKIDGMYVAVLHDDQIHDLRNGTGAGSWQDIVKYQDNVTPLRNEIGMLAGFRIVSNNDIVFADQGGAGTVDVYRGLFLGANGLGKAESQPLRLTLTGPFDALGRFVNLGWHWVGTYGIVDTAAVFVGGTASSVGANA
jgi:N4-gp56 family major capsid protein